MARGRSRSPGRKSRSSSKSPGRKGRGWFNKNNCMMFMTWQFTLFAIGMAFFTAPFFEAWGVSPPATGSETVKWGFAAMKMAMAGGCYCVLNHSAGSTATSNALFLCGLFHLYLVIDANFVHSALQQDFGMSRGGRIYNDVTNLVFGGAFAFLFSKRSDRSWHMPHFNKFTTPLIIYQTLFTAVAIGNKFFTQAMLDRSGETSNTNNTMRLQLYGNIAMAPVLIGWSALLSGDKGLQFQVCRLSALYAIACALLMNQAAQGVSGISASQTKEYVYAGMILGGWMLKNVIHCEAKASGTLKRAAGSM